MRLPAPNFEDRSPERIIEENVYFDSAGYAYRALSWLDIAKKRRNVCALQYAAHDIRQAIEQLLFEDLVMSVGTALDRKDYEKCKGNSTKIQNMIKRLSPDYDRLVQFAQAIISTIPGAPPIIVRDHSVLMRHWGVTSKYLHWGGEATETVKSDSWFDSGVLAVDSAATHIWEKMRSGLSGIMMPSDMQPEIRSLWERFRTGEIDLTAVERAAHLALPVLRRR